jgi:hypothetical protein
MLRQPTASHERLLSTDPDENCPPCSAPTWWGGQATACLVCGVFTRFLHESSFRKSETIELPGSHAIFLSHPKEVATLIEKAAKAAD